MAATGVLALFLTKKMSMQGKPSRWAIRGDSDFSPHPTVTNITLTPYDGTGDKHFDVVGNVDRHTDRLLIVTVKRKEMDPPDAKENQEPGTKGPRAFLQTGDITVTVDGTLYTFQNQVAYTDDVAN